MKKILMMILCAVMSISLNACGSSDDSKDGKGDVKEETKVSQADKLKQEDPSAYEAISFAMFEIKTNLESGLKDTSSLDVVAEYPYIDFYFKSDKTNEMMTSLIYSVESDTTIGIDYMVYYNPDTKKITRVDINTTDSSIAEKAILFAISHIKDFTSSTNVKEVLALEEALSKTDEKISSYTVSNKWTTTKMIMDNGASYTVSLLNK